MLTRNPALGGDEERSSPVIVNPFGVRRCGHSFGRHGHLIPAFLVGEKADNCPLSQNRAILLAELKSGSLRLDRPTPRLIPLAEAFHAPLQGSQARRQSHRKWQRGLGFLCGHLAHRPAEGSLRPV